MRANVIVAVIVVDIFVLILAVIVIISRPGPGGDGGIAIGPPGGVPPRVNGQIEVLGTSSGEQRPPLAGGGIGAAVASRPAQTTVTASGAGVRSVPAARFAAPANVPGATCTPSPLQTILGLVAILLGGRPAC